MNLRSVTVISLGLTTLLGAGGLPDDKKDGQTIPEPGFTALFNGKDLEGWHIMNQGQFSVKDGVQFLNRGSGWLRSDKESKDFELRMDFRFLNAGANSGIFLRASKEGNNYPSKNYQVQTMSARPASNGFAATRSGSRRRSCGAWISFALHTSASRGGRGMWVIVPRVRS
jgi:hypothetical protein